MALLHACVLFVIGIGGANHDSDAIEESFDDVLATALPGCWHPPGLDSTSVPTSVPAVPRRCVISWLWSARGSLSLSQVEIYLFCQDAQPLLACSPAGCTCPLLLAARRLGRFHGVPGECVIISEFLLQGQRLVMLLSSVGGVSYR